MLRMEIALILILAFVAVMYFSAERKKSQLHKVFSILLVVVLVHLVLDAATLYTVNHLAEVPALLNQVLHRLFVGSMALVLYLFYQYIAILIEEETGKRWKMDMAAKVFLILAEIGICLTGQIRLQKGKAHHEHQCNEQGHGDLILEESTEGAAPIAVIGVGGGLGALLAEPGGGEQLVLGQVGPSGGAVLLQLVQVVFQNSCLVIFHVEQHYRPPSFLPKLMRGSMRTMSRSPKIRPTMPTQA